MWFKTSRNNRWYPVVFFFFFISKFFYVPFSYLSGNKKLRISQVSRIHLGDVLQSRDLLAPVFYTFRSTFLTFLMSQFSGLNFSRVGDPFVTFRSFRLTDSKTTRHPSGP